MGGTSTTVAPAAAHTCARCAAGLWPGARFCHRCGQAVEGGAAARIAPAQRSTGALGWLVGLVAFVAVAAIVAGQFFTRTDASAAGTPPMGQVAPDISALTPQERADRLFDRVMGAVTEGHADSARFFAQMAILAFESLRPLSVHNRYDLGLVALVTGDGAMAAAQADTILRESPTHLLGLALAASAADALGNVEANVEFSRRLIAAEQVERGRQLVEYLEHEPQVRSALMTARAVVDSLR